MTSVQVFTWFCKEQGIISLVRHMYYVCSPRKFIENGSGQTIQISFNQWIQETVDSYGFYGLFDRIKIAYRWRCLDYSLVSSEKFERISQRWRYFVDNNIIINSTNLKVGKTVCLKYPCSRDDEYQMVIVDKINLGFGCISGHNDYTTSNWLYFIYLRDLENPQERMKINYSIKRNRRFYNGVN